MMQTDFNEFQLECYKHTYGDIIFPCDELRDTVKGQRRLWTYTNLSNYIYSYDGIHWANPPANIEDIDYKHALFRVRPFDVTLGVTDAVKKCPAAYQYSADNGYSWHTVRNPEHNTDWIYHGKHEDTWFRKLMINWDNILELVKEKPENWKVRFCYRRYGRNWKVSYGVVELYSDWKDKCDFCPANDTLVSYVVFRRMEPSALFPVSVKSEMPDNSFDFEILMNAIESACGFAHPLLKD